MPFLPPHQLCRRCLFCPPRRPVWTKAPKEGGGAGEERPKQKVRTGREFKEMFLHEAAVNGSAQAPVGGVGQGASSRNRDWLEAPAPAAWESWHQDSLTGRVNGPPGGVRKEPMAGPCATSGSAGGRKMTWA